MKTKQTSRGNDGPRGTPHHAAISARTTRTTHEITTMVLILL